MKAIVPSDKRLAAKNFGLTASDFQDMVLQLRSGDYRLYEQVFLTHFSSCIDYVKYRCKATHAEAYDATMNAMLDLCRRIKNGAVSYGNLRYLFTRMACQFYNHAKGRQERFATLDEVDLPITEDEWPEEARELIREAWQYLLEPCQELLQKFYYHQISLKILAEQSGRSEVALRKRKQRCLESLRTYFMELLEP